MSTTAPPRTHHDTLAVLDRATAFVGATGVQPWSLHIYEHDPKFGVSYDADTPEEAAALADRLAEALVDVVTSTHVYEDGNYAVIEARWSGLTGDSINVAVRRPVEGVAR